MDLDASGEGLVAALAVLGENAVIARGANKMWDAIDAKIKHTQEGDPNVAETLAQQGGGMGGTIVHVAIDVSRDELEDVLGCYMSKKVFRAWSEKECGPSVSSKGGYVILGVQLWLDIADDLE